MGNRAVITTKENFENDGIGVYLHWNGGRDSIEPILAYCDAKGYRYPERDSYGFARLCQVIGNFFGGTLSLGIDKVSNLDCDNYDNGVYIIEKWKIVDRKYNHLGEQNKWDFKEFFRSLNDAMPEDDKLSEKDMLEYFRKENR